MFNRSAMGKEFEGRILSKLTAIAPKPTVIMEKVHQV